MKSAILGHSSQEANITSYKKKSNNLIIKQHRVIVQGTIETSNSSIERGTFSQVRKAHLIMQYHRVIVKDTIETITNSEQPWSRKNTYHQVESENTTASPQVTKIEISTETYQNNIDYGTRELINSWWNSGKEKSESTAENSSVRFGRNSRW